MKKFIAVIGLIVLLNPVVVFAEDNLYIKAGAGFFNLQDADVEFGTLGQTFNAGERTFDKGFNIAVTR